jgi:Mrp family chromosome partitioning ATPase
VTNRDGLKVALDTIKNVGGNIVGVVANNTPQTKRSGYYYYSYDYSYDNESKQPLTRQEKKKKKKMKRKHQ